MIKIILLLIIPVLLFSSCSPKEAIVVNPRPAADDEPFLDLPASKEGESRKPVFVYNEKDNLAKEEILLRINSEPILLTSGYVRLVGVVSGGRPMALLEVGGRGLVVGVGEEVSEYIVSYIVKDRIRLIKKGDER
ncbi:MAG: hypothetical protein U9R38_00965 [Candidatus Margulisiibacteriota bacterium]|nr:hypothetical protein [Candidatus Margulisiibacteriota bacterium]